MLQVIASPSNHISPRRLALIAGASLLLMAVAAGFAYGYVLSDLTVADDPAATAQNILAQANRFYAGVAGWGLIALLDLIVAWALGQFFLATHRTLAQVSAWLRIIYTGFLGVAIAQLISISGWISQGKAPAMPIAAALADFEAIWGWGLIIFGGHLIALGFLAWRAQAVPKALAVLLWIAGLSYTGLELGYALWPAQAERLAQIESVMAAPMALGELLLAAWLLWKGGR